MIHKGKPSPALAIGLIPHEEDKPDGEGASDDYGDEAEGAACKEVWEAIKSDDYEAFHEALSAWFSAKESHEEPE